MPAGPKDSEDAQGTSLSSLHTAHHGLQAPLLPLLRVHPSADVSQTHGRILSWHMSHPNLSEGPMGKDATREHFSGAFP